MFGGGRAPGRRAAGGGIDIGIPGIPGIPGSWGGGKGSGGIPGIMRRGGSCCGIGGAGGIEGGTEGASGRGNKGCSEGCNGGGIGDLESVPSAAAFGVEDELDTFSGRMWRHGREEGGGPLGGSGIAGGAVGSRRW